MKIDNETLEKHLVQQHAAYMPYGPEREDYDTLEDYMLALDDFQDFLEYMYDDCKYESYFNNPYVIATEGY